MGKKMYIYTKIKSNFAISRSDILKISELHVSYINFNF